MEKERGIRIRMAIGTGVETGMGMVMRIKIRLELAVGMDEGIEAGMEMEMRMGTGMGMGTRMGTGMDPARCGLLMPPSRIPAPYKPEEPPWPTGPITAVCTAPCTTAAES